MKKIVFCVMATFLSLTFIPMQLSASNVNDPTSLVDPEPVESAEAAKVKTLELRLDEIKAMDLENMETSEKKELRKEVRSIKHELKTIGGGVYVSAGGLILVLILLIILL